MLYFNDAQHIGGENIKFIKYIIPVASLKKFKSQN